MKSSIRVNKVNFSISPENINLLKNCEFRNVRKEDNIIYLETSIRDYNKIKDKSIILDYKIENKLIEIIKKNIIIIIGTILIIILLSFQANSVTSIEFANYDTYDESVENYIKDHLYRIGPFTYLNCTITDLSLDLRSEYYNYEWIGIRKKGSILYVDINKLDSKYQNEEDDGSVGDFISKYDAYIKSFKIEKGIIVVDLNQTVNKGDILVSGNLKLKIGKIDYIKPKGVILGEVKSYETVEVNKEEYDFQSTGRLETKVKLIFFNSEFKNDSKFDDYKSEFEVLFEIKNILKIVKIYNYEIVSTYTKYSLEDAINYGKTMIYRDFRNNQVDKNERILELNYIDNVETDDRFIIKFLVRKIVNIAEFKKIDIEHIEE